MREDTEEGLQLKHTLGLRLGLGVRMQGIRPELLLALMILLDLCRETSTIVIVTAILNGAHMRNSLHYTGAAVDFVIDLAVERVPWVTELRDRLGVTYDVLDEGDHIHIEYQPHFGAGT